SGSTWTACGRSSTSVTGALRPDRRSRAGAAGHRSPPPGAGRPRSAVPALEPHGRRGRAIGGMTRNHRGGCRQVSAWGKQDYPWACRIPASIIHQERENRVMPQVGVEGYAWLDGRVMPLAEARVSLATHALHYGTGCFEGIRAYYSQADDEIYVLKMVEHYQR